MGSSGIYSEDFQLICKNIHNLFIGKMENHLIEEYRYVQLQNIETLNITKIKQNDYRRHIIIMMGKIYKTSIKYIIFTILK
jgi:hypothetical protein